jgi:hypothetical protein
MRANLEKYISFRVKGSVAGIPPEIRYLPVEGLAWVEQGAAPNIHTQTIIYYTSGLKFTLTHGRDPYQKVFKGFLSSINRARTSPNGLTEVMFTGTPAALGMLKSTTPDEPRVRSTPATAPVYITNVTITKI